MRDAWFCDLFRAIGLKELANKARRLHLPVKRDSLVLEVGSGGSPFPRSNVLLDSCEEGYHRHGAPLVADRPTVLGFGEQLPFVADSFDYAVACHVVEHSPQPDAMLDELQRVAKGGYIEVPSALYERLMCRTDHQSEIEVFDEELRIWMKDGPCSDALLMKFYQERLARHNAWQRFVRQNLDAVHVRYWWKRETGGIRYKIMNRSSWEPSTTEMAKPSCGVRTSRWLFLKAVSLLFSQRIRNYRLDIVPLLKCPNCGNVAMKRNTPYVFCQKCGAKYAIRGNLIDMRKAEN